MWNIVNLDIDIRCGHFHFKNKYLILQLKLSLQSITITGYRKRLRRRSMLDHNRKVMTSGNKCWFFIKHLILNYTHTLYTHNLLSNIPGWTLSSPYISCLFVQSVKIRKTMVPGVLNSIISQAAKEQARKSLKRKVDILLCIKISHRSFDLLFLQPWSCFQVGKGF